MAKAKKKAISKNNVWTDEEKLFSAKSKIVNLDLSVRHRRSYGFYGPKFIIEIFFLTRGMEFARRGRESAASSIITPAY